MRSGLAEILKHGLIADEKYWQKISDLSELKLSDLEEIIKESVKIKGYIVEKDPFENNIRKTLNFGHTLGHAIESYCLTSPEKEKMLHGEAIAAGMILETFLSSELKNFPKEKLNQVKEVITNMYGTEEFSDKDIQEIKALMKFDKKNEHGNINFVLLENIGMPVFDITVTDDLIKKAFNFYSNN